MNFGFAVVVVAARFGGWPAGEGAGDGSAVLGGGRGEEVVEGEDGGREVREELPFLAAVDGGREGVMEVEPVVGGSWLGEEGVVLEGLQWVRGEAVWIG